MGLATEDDKPEEDDEEEAAGLPDEAESLDITEPAPNELDELAELLLILLRWMGVTWGIVEL